jgi:hypothetical protein
MLRLRSAGHFFNFWSIQTINHLYKLNHSRFRTLVFENPALYTLQKVSNVNGGMTCPDFFSGSNPLMLSQFFNTAALSRYLCSKPLSGDRRRCKFSFTRYKPQKSVRVKQECHYIYFLNSSNGSSKSSESFILPFA